ncbi:hypothetical protein X992_4329 [Burkholderia pseudomallei MSHR5492]|nr:hypothetical protein X992_4329 [Burkholderia pseudomallei MSHR5492]
MRIPLLVWIYNQLTDCRQFPDSLHDIESQCWTISKNVVENTISEEPKALLRKASNDFAILYIPYKTLIFVRVKARHGL